MDNIMDSIQQAGIKKKSFELDYHGGKIWCEHLDGMGAYEEEVIHKFTEDISSFSRPSVSTFMIINLDKTMITDKIAELVVSNLTDGDKVFRKIAFVGVNKQWHKVFGKLKSRGIQITFLDDYEKAKEWLFA